MFKRKKSGCLTELFNLIIACILAGIILGYMQAQGITLNSGFGAFSVSKLTFAQISDVHLSPDTVNSSYRLTANSFDILEDAIAQVNNVSNLDFTMFSGDMINKPLENDLRSFLQIANTLEKPYYMIFGNHDISIGGNLSKKRFLEVVNQDRARGNVKVGRALPYYSFIPRKGFKVIALDAVIDDRITANGEIDAAQLEWLNRELSQTPKSEVVLIFSHVPLVQPFSSDSHRMLNADEVLAVLNKHQNPIAFLSGHYHTTKITKKDNIIHISTPSLISYPNAFRIINVENRRDKVVFNINFVQTRLSDVLKKSKLLVFNSDTYYGGEPDRTVILEIKKR